MAIELAHAYVSILPETKAIAPGVAKALTGVEKTADKSGKSMGSKLSTGMGSVLKKSAVGVGAAAGAALGAGLTKGIGRLNSIEQAEAKLKGLGHSAQSVGGIMENSLAAVKGTAFGLEEAATTAAGVVAAGIKPGKELEQVLKTVGDTATIAGTSMSEMGTIFGSVAARGKLQGDDMLQLMSRGVPVLQLLGDELGKTSAEISDMVSKGQIDFATFERAMRKGMGGAALEAGNTVQGAMRNMGAAAGRLGATLAGPFFKRAAGGFNGVTAALDAMDARMKPVMANVDKWLTGTAVPALERFGASASAAFDAFKNSGTVTRTVDVFKSLGQAAMDLAPSLLGIAKNLGQASAALGVGTWQVFLTTLEAVGAVAKALAPPLEAISNFMSDHPAAVTAAVAAWTGFKTIPGIIGKIKPVFDTVQKTLIPHSNTVKAITGDYRTLSPEIGRTGAAMRALGRNNSTIRAMQDALMGASSMSKGFGQAIKVGVTPALQSMRKGIGSVVDAFGGPWGVAIMGAAAAISAVRDASARAESAQQKLAGSSRALADAQQELRAELAGTTGKLTDQGIAAAAKVAEASFIDLAAAAETTSGFISKIELPEDLKGGAYKDIVAYQNSIQDLGDAYRAIESAAKDMGYSMEDVNRIVAQGGPEYDRLMSSLRGMGDDGQLAADKLGEVRKQVQDSIDAARRLDPAFTEASSAIDVLADSSSSADEKLSALNQMMQLMGLSPKNAEQAMMDAADAIDQMAAKAAEGIDASAGLGDAMFDMSGKLDPANANARQLHDSLSEMSSTLQNVAVNGGDVQGAFELMQPELQKLGEQFGLSESQMQGLLKQFGLVPEDITTLVNLAGADEATQDVLAVKAAIEASPDKKSIEVALHDEESAAKLKDLGFKLETLPDGNTKVHVADEAAKAKLDSFLNTELSKIDNAKPTAHAVLDASGLFATKEYALAQLATIDLQRPTPLANMDIGQLDAKQIEALQKVGLLDGQTPTPDAYMNIDQLSADQQIALAKVFDLDSQRPTPISNLDKAQLDAKANDANARLKRLHDTKTEPKVSANTAEAMSKLGGVKSLLSSLKDKVVNIFVNRHDRQSGNASGGRFADGGKLPKYAKGNRHDGYRIPNTGPGSHGTDEWLAVDQYNQPVARLDHGEWIINRRSSARYDKELAAINAGTFPKLPGYADGGMFDDLQGGKPLRTAEDFLRFARGEMVDGVQASRPLEGAPYVWGGSDWGDCSGAASAFSAFAVGLDPFPRKFATASEEQWLRDHGFTMGAGPAGSFRVGWFNGGSYGGHTSVTLPDGTNAEMGGGRGNGQLGGPAAGADHSQYTHRAWFPAASDTPAPEMEPVAAEYSTTITESGSSTTSGGDDNLVPLSPEAGAAADTLDSADPGLLGGASTWSDFGGSVVAAAVSGQIADVLGVFGIPNELPPVVKAGQQWYQAAREANQKTADFMNAEADLIRAADAVEEAQANPDAVTDAVDATVEVDATSTAADAVSEVAEPAPDVPEWGPEFFASEIARAAKDMGLSKKAAEIGVATALVESGDPMQMYANNSVPESLNYRHDAVGSDHDSVGLFQQRDNGAWGTVAQRMDPYESAKMFFAELMKIDWENMDPGAAAQAVQRSAFPDRYATKMQRARDMLASIPAFKKGGMVAGGAGKNLDDVLAWLSNGEMVINSDSVDADPGMAQTLNEQGPDAVKAQVLSEYAPVSPNASVEPDKRVVQTFDVDPGSIQNTINGALPMLMAQNSWADAAKLVTSSAVSFAGNLATDAVSGAVDMVAEAGMSALGMAGAPTLGAMVGAATAPVTGALGPAAGAMAGTAAAPFGSLLGQVMPLTPGDMVGAAGGVMTDAAAWYAGEVAWGVTNAFEQYSKDLFGTVLLPFQDVMGVLKSPVVGDLAAQAGIDIPGGRSFADMVPEPVRTAASEMGNVYNFYATNREGMYSDFRRELAKDSKGLIGAR